MNFISLKIHQRLDITHTEHAQDTRHAQNAASTVDDSMAVETYSSLKRMFAADPRDVYTKYEWVVLSARDQETPLITSQLKMFEDVIAQKERAYIQELQHRQILTKTYGDVKTDFDIDSTGVQQIYSELCKYQRSKNPTICAVRKKYTDVIIQKERELKKIEVGKQRIQECKDDGFKKTHKNIIIAKFSSEEIYKRFFNKELWNNIRNKYIIANFNPDDVATLKTNGTLSSKQGAQLYILGKLYLVKQAYYEIIRDTFTLRYRQTLPIRMFEITDTWWAEHEHLTDVQKKHVQTCMYKSSNGCETCNRDHRPFNHTFMLSYQQGAAR